MQISKVYAYATSEDVASSAVTMSQADVVVLMDVAVQAIVATSAARRRAAQTQPPQNPKKA
jgi:hypothetical protein